MGFTEDSVYRAGATDQEWSRVAMYFAWLSVFVSLNSLLGI